MINHSMSYLNSLSRNRPFSFSASKAVMKASHIVVILDQAPISALLEEAK